MLVQATREKQGQDTRWKHECLFFCSGVLGGQLAVTYHAKWRHTAGTLDKGKGDCCIGHPQLWVSSRITNLQRLHPFNQEVQCGVPWLPDMATLIWNAGSRRANRLGRGRCRRRTAMLKRDNGDLGTPVGITAQQSTTTFQRGPQLHALHLKVCNRRGNYHLYLVGGSHCHSCSYCLAPTAHVIGWH